MWPLALLLALLPTDGEGCPDCRYTGIVPCTGHREPSEEPTEALPLVHCSWASACSMCGGTLWYDCGRCTGGPRSAWLEQRLAEESDWAQENELEKAVGHPVGRIETARFELVVAADGLKERSRRVSAHELAHQLAEDVEHVAALVAEHYGVTPEDYSTKMRMWVWGDRKTHEAAMGAFLGTISSGDFKALAALPTFTVWPERPHFDDVPKLRAVFVHNAPHLLLTNAFGTGWVGDIGGGWLDAGAGHWYEYERFGQSLNACIEEATLNDAWEGGLWRAAMRKRLAKEKEPVLPGVFGKRTGAMSSEEQAVCYSFHDYLVAQHPAALGPMLKALKRREKPARDILAEHTGLGLLEAEEAWRAWVQETYPRRETRPR
jgi:hypothetical protein